MSHSGAVLALVALSCVGRSLAGNGDCGEDGSTSCPNCSCFPVNTRSTPLEELVAYSPLYLQAASTFLKPFNLDSVCVQFSDTKVPDNILSTEILTSTNKSEQSYAFIVTTVGVGHFYFIGPYGSFDDFVLGNPCNGTYVIYQCLHVEPCVVCPSDVIVGIISNVVRGNRKCINAGIAIARKSFPGLGFYILPRTVPDPCYS